jgi:hypothetical protein
MDINSINRRHFKKYEKYYNVEFGVSTRLVDYKNGILFIEVIISSKWTIPAYKTALEIAKHWKNTHPELKYAIGAKIFIADLNEEDKNTFSKIKIKYKKGILFNYWNKN